MKGAQRKLKDSLPEILFWQYITHARVMSVFADIYLKPSVFHFLLGTFSTGPIENDFEQIGKNLMGLAF